MNELEKIHRQDILLEQQRQLNAELKKKDKYVSKVVEEILGAKNKYLRAKTKSRSTKLANDMNKRFAELNGYDSYQDLQESYGCGSLTSKEYDRLCDLWELRQKLQIKNNQEKYEDEITKLYDIAIYAVTSTKSDLVDKLYDVNAELSLLENSVSDESEAEE